MLCGVLRTVHIIPQPERVHSNRYHWEIVLLCGEGCFLAHLHQPWSILDHRRDRAHFYRYREVFRRWGYHHRCVPRGDEQIIRVLRFILRFIAKGELYTPLLPVILVFFISAMVGHVFMVVYGMGIDTILQVFGPLIFSATAWMRSSRNRRTWRRNTARRR